MLKIFESFIKVIEILIGILFSFLIVIVAIQVIGRLVPFIPRFIWTVEVSEFLLIWLIFLGAIIGLKEEKHFFIDVLTSSFQEKNNKFLRIIYYLSMFFASFVFIFYGYKFFLSGIKRTSPITGMNFGMVNFTIFFFGISILFVLCHNIYKEKHFKNKKE